MTRSIYPSLVVTRTPPPTSTPPPGRRQRLDLGVNCKPPSVRISGYATAVSEGVAHHCIDAIHLSDDSKRYAAGTIMTPTYVASATWSSTEQLARPSPKRATGDLWRRAVDRGHGGVTTRRLSSATRLR